MHRPLFGILAALLATACATSTSSAPAASASASPEAAPTGEATLLVTGFEDSAPGSQLVTYADSASRITAEIVTNPVHSGKQALLVKAATQQWAGAVIPLSGKQASWTGMTTLKLWIQGGGTGRRFDLQLQDAQGELFIKNVKDDFTGWKQIVLPLADIGSRKDYQNPGSKVDGKIEYPLTNIQISTNQNSGGAGSLTLGFDDIEVTR